MQAILTSCSSLGVKKILLVLALGFCEEVLAQQNSDVADEAGVQFMLGNAAYRSGDFRAALAHYFASNRLAPNRNVVFNIARCYEQLKEYVEAYRYYVLCSSPNLPRNERRALKQAMARVRPYVGLLNLTTQPPGATLYLDRRDLGGYGTTPRVLALPPGVVRVILDYPGYVSYEKPGIELEAGQEIRLHVDLTRIEGQLHVTGIPAGAKVQVEDSAGPVLGAIPGVLNLAPGEHRVIVSHDGYVSKEALVKVEAKRISELRVELVPKTGALVVQANENDALVMIDGEPAGFTPAVIDNLRVGPHELRVQLEGFHPYESKVVVKPDERGSVDVILQLADDVAAASRLVESLQDAPASVTLVSRPELSSFAFTNVAEAIQGVRGIYLTNDGTYFNAGIRGFSPFGQYGNRLLVQLDGHSLNDDWIGSSYIEFDLLTDLTAIERIEVIRGPGSALYGTGAFLGVLNLASPNEVSEERVRASVSRVNSGAPRLSVGGGAPLGESGGFWVSAGGIWGQGEDYFSKSYVGSTEVPDGVARGVGGFEAVSFLGKTWWRDLTLQWYWNRRNKQIPTGSFGTIFGDTRTHNNDLRGFAELRYEPHLSESLQVLARAYYDHSFFQGIYSYDDLNFGIARETHTSNWIGAELRSVLTPAARLRVTAGGGYEFHFNNRAHGEDQSARPEYLNESHPFQSFSVYAVADFAATDWLSLSLGGRFDGWLVTGLGVSAQDQKDRFFQSTNPRLAILLHPSADGTLKLLGGRAFRAPSVYELTYEDGGLTTVPSPNLEPEEIFAGEVEYTHRLPEGLWLTGAVFWNYLTRTIEQVGAGTPETPFSLVNRDRSAPVQTVGVEAEFRKEFRRGWMFGVQLSLQQTRLTALSTGERVPNSPELMGAFSLMFPLSKPDLRLATRLAIETGRLDRLRQRTDPTLLWDLTLSGEVRAIHLRYAFGVRNLLDWKYVHPVSEAIADPAVSQAGINLIMDLVFSY